tara:strand:+ start:218 stop:628 length:411 start_codon:yes stop_codon:yes gene_type:complete
MTDKRSEYISQKLIDSFYEKVAEDLANNIQDKGVWTKAFTKAGGDEQKTKALYIQLMVDELILSQEAIAEDEEEKRLQELKTDKDKNQKQIDKDLEEKFLKAQEWGKSKLFEYFSIALFLFLVTAVVVGILNLLGF